MSVRLWRVYNPSFRGDPFDGEGARRVGGRWNSEGVPVVYCSGSLALAVLEVLVNAKTNLALISYLAVSTDVDEKQIERLDERKLPAEWRQAPPPYSVQRIGDGWVTACTSLALEVPGAVIPLEKNYVLNPRHPAFKGLVKSEPIPLPIDPRLLKREELGRR
jgi:RES domain-containing protein